MSKYTIEDVGHIIHTAQTASVREAVEAYLNEGVIPPADPCMSCEPNHIRKLISLIQVGERNGLFPPKREVNESQNPDVGDYLEDGHLDSYVEIEELFEEDE